MKHNTGYIMMLVTIALLAVTFYYYISWTDGNIEYAVSYFKERDVSVPFWMSAIIAVFGNIFTFIFNIVCEITKL